MATKLNRSFGCLMERLKLKRHRDEIKQANGIQLAGSSNIENIRTKNGDERESEMEIDGIKKSNQIANHGEESYLVGQVSSPARGENQEMKMNMKPPVVQVQNKVGPKLRPIKDVSEVQIINGRIACPNGLKTNGEHRIRRGQIEANENSARFMTELRTKDALMKLAKEEAKQNTDSYQSQSIREDGIGKFCKHKSAKAILNKSVNDTNLKASIGVKSYKREPNEESSAIRLRRLVTTSIPYDKGSIRGANMMTDRITFRRIIANQPSLLYAALQGLTQVPLSSSTSLGTTSIVSLVFILFLCGDPMGFMEAKRSYAMTSSAYLASNVALPSSLTHKSISPSVRLPFPSGGINEKGHKFVIPDSLVSPSIGSKPAANDPIQWYQINRRLDSTADRLGLDESLVGQMRSFGGKLLRNTNQLSLGRFETRNSPPSRWISIFGPPGSQSSDRSPPDSSSSTTSNLGLRRRRGLISRTLNRLAERIGARNTIRVHNAFRDLAWRILSRLSMPTPIIYELRRQNFYPPEEDVMNDSLFNKNTTRTIRTGRQLRLPSMDQIEAGPQLIRLAASKLFQILPKHWDSVKSSKLRRLFTTDDDDEENE